MVSWSVLTRACLRECNCSKHSIRLKVQHHQSLHLKLQCSWQYLDWLKPQFLLLQLAEAEAELDAMTKDRDELQVVVDELEEKVTPYCSMSWQAA